MSESLEFIEQYPSVNLSSIKMVWNGKRGPSFHDDNQTFRERVIQEVLRDLNKVDHRLIYALMHEEACWASKNLTFRYYLTDLLEFLMIHYLSVYKVKIAETFQENPYALKAIIDFKSDERQISQWVQTLKREEGIGVKGVYKDLIDELDHLLAMRADAVAKEEAFEDYVNHRDPIHIAAINNVKRLWKQGETAWLALFFILPLALLLGYHLFGMAIIVGLRPILWTMLSLYMIYRVANWITR